MIHAIPLESNRGFYLRPLSKGEVEEVRVLCDECVGANLYSKEEIAAAMEDEDSSFCLLKSEDGETAGYLYYRFTDAESVAKELKLDAAMLRGLCPGEKKKAGRLQSAGLKLPYRGRGLAVEMIRLGLRELKAGGADIVFAVCWKPGGVVPIGRALSESNFVFLTEAKKPWYDDERLICPYCGGRCLCDAEVYYKLLDGEKSHEV